MSRFPLVSRILGAGCGSAFLGLLALSAMASAVIKADASELPTLLLVACLAGGGAAGMYRGFVHPSLTTSHKGLDVRNPFSHTLVPWEQMDRLVPDSNGLVIVRHRLPTVRVWVIQKSQWSIARNREVRADRIARHLAARWLESTGAPEQHLATEGPAPDDVTRRALGRSFLARPRWWPGRAWRRAAPLSETETEELVWCRLIGAPRRSSGLAHGAERARCRYPVNTGVFRGPDANQR